MAEPAGDVTAMIRAWRQGDQLALDRLLPLVYQELRRVARSRLRSEPPGHLLQTTALVHEAYLRLVDINQMDVHDRGHLLALAGRLMREVLVDYARRQRAAKRGGDVTIVSLDGMDVLSDAPSVEVLALDEALDDLVSLDPRLSRVVELKCFAGLTNSEAAHALGVSTATVERDWTLARAWLCQRLTSLRGARNGSAGDDGGM